MFRIEFSQLAAKETEKIFRSDKKLYSRLMAAVEDLTLNPFQGKRLKGKLSGDYSLRIGDYRLIYTVHQQKLIIYIIDLGHRREIYR